MKWDHFALCVSKNWTLGYWFEHCFYHCYDDDIDDDNDGDGIIILFHNNDNYYYCRRCCCLFVCFFPAFQPSETEIFSDLKWKMRLYTLIVLDL